MSDTEKYPSQLAERFQVRLPDGMRDRLREAAEENNRSMNAEIVARLEASFAPTRNMPAAEVPAQPPTPENTVYILLDTNGMPISWQEALTHLSEINKASKSKVVSQNARILASEHVSSSGREDEDVLLFMKYRALNKKHLSKAARQFLESYSNLLDETASNKKNT